MFTCRMRRSCLISKQKQLVFNFKRSFGVKIARHKNVTDTFIKTLSCAIGKEHVNTSLALREQCGTDEGYHGTSASDVVVFPQSREHICEIAKLCSKSSVPIIPRGTGTGLEHGVGALLGGVCIDLSQMTSILEVNEEDFDCTVESGVTRKTLETYLKHTGLMFPIQELMPH